MKKTLTLLFTLFTSVSFCQTANIQKITWVSNDLGGIRFYKEQIDWYSNDTEHIKRYRTVKDTLIMFDDYTVNGNPTRYIDLFKFLFTQQGDRTLTITPINTNARALAKGKLTVFTNFKYLKDQSVKFKRIHFNSGYCYGTCPVLNIDIDSTGFYYLKGGEYAEPYRGYFVGRLTTSQLDTLNQLVQSSHLQQLQNWKQKEIVMDTPPYNLTIFYNGKNVKLHTNYPPFILQDLISYLVSSYKKVLLAPAKTRLDFEEDKDKLYY